MANGNEDNSLGLNNVMGNADINSVAFSLAQLVKKITLQNDNVVRVGNHFAGTVQDKVVL